MAISLSHPGCYSLGSSSRCFSLIVPFFPILTYFFSPLEYLSVLKSVLPETAIYGKKSEHLISIPTSASDQLHDPRYPPLYTPHTHAFSLKRKVYNVKRCFCSIVFASILCTTNIIQFGMRLKFTCPQHHPFSPTNQEVLYILKFYSFL